MRKKKLVEWTVLGRVIGQASGWDQSNDFAINLYDFVPIEGCKIPAGVPFIDFDNGWVEMWSDDGEQATFSMDLIEAIGHLPRK